MVGHLLAADRSEEDGVELAQLLEPALGDVMAMLQVVVGAPGKALYLEAEIGARCDRLEHLQAGRDDLDADAVAGDGRDAVGAHGPRILAERTFVYKTIGRDERGSGQIRGPRSIIKTAKSTVR